MPMLSPALGQRIGEVREAGLDARVNDVTTQGFDVAAERGHVVRGQN